MADSIVVEKIKEVVPDAEFRWRNDKCIGASFTCKDYLYYGIIRRYSDSEKNNILSLVAKLDCLEFLDLRKNRLGKLPCLGHLTALKHLDISSNYLGVCPEWINRLPNLTYLDLGVNELKSIPNMLIPNLQVLKIHKNQISKYPEIDGSNLKVLNLYLNRFKLIPTAVFSYAKLEYFSWGVSGLTAIPEEIGNLINLKYLSIVLNKIEYLPESLCTLTGLEGMRLHKNKIRRLPSAIGNLINLKDLSLYSNQLSNLPASFFELNLQRLNLAKNHLSSVPPFDIPWLSA